MSPGNSKTTLGRDKRILKYTKFGEICDVQCVKCTADQMECVWYFGVESKCAACIKTRKNCEITVQGGKLICEEFWAKHVVSSINIAKPKASTLAALLAKNKRGRRKGVKRNLPLSSEVNKTKRAKIDSDSDESNEDTETNDIPEDNKGLGDSEGDWDELDRLLEDEAIKEEDWEAALEIEDNEESDEMQKLKETVENLNVEVEDLTKTVEELKDEITEIKKQKEEDMKQMKDEITEIKKQREEDMKQMKERMLKLINLIKI